MVSESSNPDHHELGEESTQALALVLSDQGRKIAVTVGDRPSLPTVAVQNRFYPEIEEFMRAAVNDLGVELSMLRCLDYGSSEESRPRLYSLTTNHVVDEMKGGYRRADFSVLDRITGLSEEHVSSIRLEHDRVFNSRPVHTAVPWQWPGQWDSDVQEWVGSHLRSLVGSSGWVAAPVRSWSISSVARIDVGPAPSSERFFFKASPTFFSNEAALTDVVAGRFPEVSPSLVGVDRDRGWMLMHDLGDLTLGAADSIDLWSDAMQALARVQTGFAENPVWLDCLDLERRNLSDISNTLRQWTQNPGDLGLHYVSELTRSALDRLEPLTGVVDQLCGQIESIGLPPTLDHGDLDGGNVFVRDGAPVIMDWSDASVSSPLFTAALIPQVSRNPLLESAFLEEWTGFASMGQLQAGLQAARPVAALERAFHYHRNIVAHLTYPSVDLRVLEAYIPGLLNLAASGLERHT